MVDIQDVLKKHKTWVLNMPRVKPYYAVKCNGVPIILEVLAALGIGFDCASKVRPINSTEEPTSASSS